MFSKVLISDFILLSFTTYPPQHSHLYCIHFSFTLLLDWPTFCSIGRSWFNRYLVKVFIQSCWHLSITKHSISKFTSTIPLLSMSNIFINLLIFINYIAKVVERNTLWKLLVFNSHSSFSFFYMPTEAIIHIFLLRAAYFRFLDSKALHHLSTFAFSAGNALDPAKMPKHPIKMIWFNDVHAFKTSSVTINLLKGVICPMLSIGVPHYLQD